MRRCQFCNTELHELARFCSNCGYMVPPVKEVQSDDASTVISNAPLPTVISEMPIPDDAPTIMSDSSLRTFPETPNPDDSTLWGWSYEQDVPNSQLPGDRQTDESQSLLIEPLFPGAPSTLSSPSPGQMPMVQSTPQVGGVPTVQGTPSMLHSPPAANSPLTTQGIGHDVAPSAPPSAAPQPEHLRSVETPQTQQVSHVTHRTPTIHFPKSKRRRAAPKKKSPRFDRAIERITHPFRVLFKMKNIKVLLLLGAIFIVLGGGGVFATDEASERGDSTGFLGFDEPIERQLAEPITHTQANALATAYAGTVAASQHLYPNGGTLVYNDTLNSESKTLPWVPGYQAAGTNCSFTNGTFHVVESNQNRFYYCVADKTNFSNFVFQVQMTILRGNAGGIVFHDIGPDNNYFRLYYFSIGQNGSYNLQRFVHDPRNSSNQLVNGQSTFIKTGLGQTNLITVVARGNNIDLYVNQRYLATVTDSTYAQGQIGLAAQDQGDPTEVAFSNAQVYALPR